MYITSPLSPQKMDGLPRSIPVKPVGINLSCPEMATTQATARASMQFPRFSGKSTGYTGMTAAEAQRLAGYLRQLGVLSDKISMETVQARLASGDSVGLEDTLYYGLVKLTNGKPVVSGMSAQLQPVAEMLFDKPAELPPEMRQKLTHGGLVLALRPLPSLKALREGVANFPDLNNQADSEPSASEKDERAESPEEQEKKLYDQFMERAFLPRFRMKLDDGKGNSFEQTVAWPIFQSIMSNPNKVSEPVRGFMGDVEKLGLYRLSSPDLGAPALKTLQDRFKPLAQRLAAFKLAEKHYLDSLDFKEIVLPMLIGVLVGGGGETALEMAHMDQSSSAGLIRTGLLVGVDVVDNLFAQIPNVMQGIAKNGGKLSWPSVTGSPSGGDYLRRVFKGDFALRGEVGDTVADAAKSASMGALTGSVFALPAGKAISDLSEPLWARAAMGGMGAWGTSLSLPFKLRRDNAKMEAAVSKMLDEGILSRRAIGGSKAEKAYIKKMLLQEAMAGMGNAASMQAFGLVPIFSGGMQALEVLGVPHKWAQKLYMSVSPGAENVLSLFFMALRQYVTAPRDMRAVEGRILASGAPQTSKAMSGKPSAKVGDDEDFIAGRFGNSFSKSLGALVSSTAAFGFSMAAVLATMYLYTFRKWLLKAAGVKVQAGEKAVPKALPTNQMRLSPTSSFQAGLPQGGPPLSSNGARYMPRYLNPMPPQSIAPNAALPSNVYSPIALSPFTATSPTFQANANPMNPPGMLQTSMLPNRQTGPAYPAWQITSPSLPNVAMAPVTV